MIGGGKAIVTDHFGPERRFDLSPLQRLPVDFADEKCVTFDGFFAALRSDATETFCRILSHELKEQRLVLPADVGG